MKFKHWGIRLTEQRAAAWPGPRGDSSEVPEIWYRALSVHAPVDVLFRWVCQLRVAPYSYDWIDNWGRQSPRNLVDGLDQLRIGQKVMTTFRVQDFLTDQYLILALWPPRGFFCSDLRLTYLCKRIADEKARLMVRVEIRYPKHPFRFLIRLLLPIGDLLMMRKQLLTLKRLAERHIGDG